MIYNIKFLPLPVAFKKQLNLFLDEKQRVDRRRSSPTQSKDLNKTTLSRKKKEEAFFSSILERETTYVFCLVEKKIRFTDKAQLTSEQWP